MRDTLAHIQSGNGSKLEDTEARTKIIETLMDAVRVSYASLAEQMIKIAADEDVMRKVEKSLWLRAIDMLWVEHLDAIDHLRKGIGLRAYGQQEPLIAYKKEAYRMFQELQHLIDKQVVYGIFKVGVTAQEAPSLLERRGMQMSAPAKTMSEGSGTGGHVSGVGSQVVGEPKVGRNDPCYCGSGKKYKKCHGV